LGFWGRSCSFFNFMVPPFFLQHPGSWKFLASHLCRTSFRKDPTEPIPPQWSSQSHPQRSLTPCPAFCTSWCPPASHEFTAGHSADTVQRGFSSTRIDDQTWWTGKTWSFIMLILCITFIDLCMLSHPCIPKINLTWSWWMILSIYCWIHFASIFLRIFTSVFIITLNCETHYLKNSIA
jgi:hypothetical protein